MDSSTLKTKCICQLTGPLGPTDHRCQGPDMSHLGMGGSRAQRSDTLHIMRQSLMRASDQGFPALDGGHQCWGLLLSVCVRCPDRDLQSCECIQGPAPTQFALPR